MIYEDGYTVRELKPIGNYTIDKVTEKDGSIYYDIYDEECNLQEVCRTLKEARKWAQMMSK